MCNTFGEKTRQAAHSERQIFGICITKNETNFLFASKIPAPWAENRRRFFILYCTCCQRALSGAGWCYRIVIETSDVQISSINSLPEWESKRSHSKSHTGEPSHIRQRRMWHSLPYNDTRKVFLRNAQSFSRLTCQKNEITFLLPPHQHTKTARGSSCGYFLSVFKYVYMAL